MKTEQGLAIIGIGLLIAFCLFWLLFAMPGTSHGERAGDVVELIAVAQDTAGYGFIPDNVRLLVYRGKSVVDSTSYSQAQLDVLGTNHGSIIKLGYQIPAGADTGRYSFMLWYEWTPSVFQYYDVRPCFPSGVDVQPSLVEDFTTAAKALIQTEVDDAITAQEPIDASVSTFTTAAKALIQVEVEDGITAQEPISSTGAVTSMSAAMLDTLENRVAEETAKTTVAGLTTAAKALIQVEVEDGITAQEPITTTVSWVDSVGGVGNLGRVSPLAVADISDGIDFSGISLDGAVVEVDSMWASAVGDIADTLWDHIFADGNNWGLSHDMVLGANPFEVTLADTVTIGGLTADAVIDLWTTYGDVSADTLTSARGGIITRNGNPVNRAVVYATYTNSLTSWSIIPGGFAITGSDGSWQMLIETDPAASDTAYIWSVYQGAWASSPTMVVVD